MSTHHSGLRATPGKRRLYITAFTILGILCQFLLHALVEIQYISLLRADFDRYGFGWSWDTWYRIHHVGTAALLVLGTLVGFVLGRYFWRILYVEHRYPHFKRWFGP